MQSFVFTMLLIAKICLSWKYFHPRSINRKIQKVAGPVSSPTFAASPLCASNGHVDIEDDEDNEIFKRIASSYLEAKLQELQPAVDTLSKEDVKTLLKQVLPPISVTELERETVSIYKNVATKVSKERLVTALMDNNYWIQAGPLVVQELIYLDCLYHFYYKQRSYLSDADYNALKEMLAWQGSRAASLTAKEALFITAVSAHNRGQSLLNNEEYEALKSELRGEQSWVVLRQMDPLEKLGLSTFMSYLHKSL